MGIYTCTYHTRVYIYVYNNNGNISKMCVRIVGCSDVLFSVNVSGLESLLFSPIFFVIRDKIISGRVLNRDEMTTSPRAWLRIKTK